MHDGNVEITVVSEIYKMFVSVNFVSEVQITHSQLGQMVIEIN
jgi:hypothetical protein